MTSVLALNVAAPIPERAEPLLEYLWHRDEQVWVLTEVTGAAGSRLVLDVCRAAGFGVHVAPLGARDRGTAVVVRDDAAAVTDVTYPAGPRIVGVTLDGLRLLGVYGAASDPVRYSSRTQRERKREWLTQFLGVVAEESRRPGPVLVVGDLNIVDPDDGPGLPYILEEERQTYDRLSELGFVDAYREAVGESRVTWVDHSGAGCRYDHAFARGLAVHGAQIDDAPRVAGHTDHSALAVDVDPSREPGE